MRTLNTRMIESLHENLRITEAQPSGQAFRNLPLKTPLFPLHILAALLELYYFPRFSEDFRINQDRTSLCLLEKRDILRRRREDLHSS